MTNELDYKVIATGSTGNAVRIGHIMIDCGVPFKHMEEELYKCDTLLLTHTHSDHINARTLLAIRKKFPRIRVYGNYDVAYQYAVDEIMGTTEFKIPRRETFVMPFEGKHDVPVTYFSILMDGIKIFYATDTCEVDNPYYVKYDYIFLEANYDIQILRQAAKDYARRGYDPITNAARHLSLQACKAFYYMYRKDESTPLIELHMSRRFR